MNTLIEYFKEFIEKVKKAFKKINPKKIPSIVLTGLLILIIVFFAPLRAYTELKLQVGFGNNLKIFTYSEQFGNMVLYRERYFPSDTFARFFYEGNGGYFTVLTCGQDVYFSFYENMKETYKIDNSLLNGDEVREFIKDKAVSIETTYKDGLSDLGFLFGIKRYGPVETEGDTYFEDSERYYVTIKAHSGEKSILSKTQRTSGEIYLNYSEGKFNYQMSSGELPVKIGTDMGSITTAEQFDELLEESRIDTTFEKLFGK